MNRVPLVYVAGPYRDSGSYLEISQNILNATKACEWLVGNGIWFLSPHRNSAHFEVVALPPARTSIRDFYLDMALRLLEGCDAVLVLAGISEGVKAEIAKANQLKIPVFYFKEIFSGMSHSNAALDIYGLLDWRDRWVSERHERPVGKPLQGTQLRQF